MLVLICIMNHFQKVWLCFLGKQEKSRMRPRDYLYPKLSILKQPFSPRAKLVYWIVQTFWARRNNFHALLYLRPWSLDTQTSFPGERYLIKLPSTDSCLIGLILNYNSLIYYSSKIYAPFSDWLKGQLVLTVFGRCEQHTIDSMVYISLETREIGHRSTSFSMRGRLAVIHEWTKKWRSRLSEDEVAEFLTKTARNKCKNVQNISLVDSILLDLHNSLHPT